MELQEYTIKVTYKETNEYPSFGKFVGLIQNDDLTYSECPRNYIKEDMEGVFLGYVKELTVYNDKPSALIRVCGIDTPLLELEQLNNNTNTIHLSADVLVVLDIMFSNDTLKKSFSSTEMDVKGLYDWICDSDTYSGEYYDFLEDNCRGVTERYFELCDKPLPTSYLDAISQIDNPTQESNQINKEQTQEDKENVLYDYFTSNMSDVRAKEYDFHERFIQDVDMWSERNPYLMNNGNTASICIASDFIFKIIPNNDGIYLKNFAREFLISCAYLGAEITIICSNVRLCKEMLHGGDIPYHHLMTPNIALNNYSYTCVNVGAFEGFISVFQTLYSADLMEFQELIGHEYDTMRDILNSLYNDNFQYSALVLSDIMKHMKENKK